MQPRSEFIRPVRSNFGNLQLEENVADAAPIDARVTIKEHEEERASR